LANVSTRMASDAKSPIPGSSARSPLSWFRWSGIGKIWSTGEGPAYEAWRARPETGGPLQLVHAAILAANAHNSQPWLFRVGGDRIGICADYGRHLGSFDPFRRELHLSLGCALENLVHAARAQGLEPNIEMLPGRLGLPPPAHGAKAVANVALVAAEQAASELFHAIPRRHTHRGAYLANRAIPAHLLADMKALVPADQPLRLLLFTGTDRDPLAKLIVAATRAIVEDEQMAADNARWFRFRQEAIERHRDGLTLDANVVPPLLNMAAKMFPPSDARANRRWVTDTAKIHLGTAPLLGLIMVRDLYDRPPTLAAGRLWQRLHLWMTARGLAAQPLNQPVERVDRERELKMPDRTAEDLARVTRASDWQPTFVFRAGYARRPARLSPRRTVESIVA
jgi:hypothetical protein